MAGPDFLKLLAICWVDFSLSLFIRHIWGVWGHGTVQTGLRLKSEKRHSFLRFPHSAGDLLFVWNVRKTKEPLIVLCAPRAWHLVKLCLGNASPIFQNCEALLQNQVDLHYFTEETSTLLPRYVKIYG